MGRYKSKKRIKKLFTIFFVFVVFCVYALPGAAIHVFASGDDAADLASPPTEEEDQGENSPASPVEIQDDEIPLSAIAPPNQFLASYNFTAWALLNLILVIATGLIMLGILIYCIRKLKACANESGYRAKRIRTLGLGIIAVGATAVSIILLSATQDMSLPMIYMDNWTIWHAVIAVVVVFAAEFERKKSEVIDAKKSTRRL